MEDVEGSLFENIEEYAKLDNDDLLVNFIQEQNCRPPMFWPQGESLTNQRQSNYTGRFANQRDGKNDQYQSRDRQRKRG